jgi:DNA polymerase-1
MEALGVRVVMAPGYEADDLVAKFTRQARADGVQVVIVSRDKDLMQLLAPGVTMFDNRSDLVMDEAWLLAEKGLRPDQVVDMLALMGDASDNIPGVPGIGEKRAVGLLQQYGSLDGVLSHADEIKGKMGESLRANVDVARLSQRLATLDPEVPVELSYRDLTIAAPDRPRLAALFETLAFSRLLEEFRDAAPAAPKATAAGRDYRCVTTLDELKRLAARMAKAPAFAFDTEATGLDPLRDALVGVSFSCEEGCGYYLPVKAPEGEPVFDLATMHNVLAPALGNATSLKIAHNAKFDLAMLKSAGLDVAGPLFDTMIASYLLDAGSRHHSLDALAEELLNYTTIPITALIGEKKRGSEQKTMDQVPLKEISVYAAEDAEVTWRLYRVFEPRMKEAGVEPLFREVEMPLVRCLERMERAGVALDVMLLARLSDEFGLRLAKLERQIYAAAGHEFNIASPKQLEKLLFDELGLKAGRKTKTGRSTDADTLELLADEHPVPRLILEYRTLSKLKSTYIDALPLLVNPRTGRVHASFNQAVTATGRLSSSDPNLQNIPIRGTEGREIREAFVPGDSAHDVLLTADYSQIELRLLAHFCQDPFLLDAFHRDLDIHAFVASEIFGVPQEQVTDEQRARAKAVNFSLIYGKTAYGLSRDLGIPVGEAADFIKAYFSRYTKVKEFMVEVLEGAKQNEYVTTILGRRRPTPGVKFTDAERWNNAERAAFNTVLQGSAADLIKVAMNRIDRRIVEEQRPSRMILQVHDELVFEVPIAAVVAEREMIVREMTGAIELRVPMKVNVASGPNWREAK